MIEVKGKANIVVRVVCDSISPDGVRLTTLECEYPRIVLSELNTHRMLSRNSASSRAIPFEKMLQQLNGRPVRFGAANKGMQDKGEDFHNKIRLENAFADEFFADPEYVWEMARDSAIEYADAFQGSGYHKQVYNRLVEPFQMIKTVISATEWNNFFHLRLDSAADPTIYELARCMKKAMDSSKPQELKAGEWHLPYVEALRLKGGSIYGYTMDNSVDSLSTSVAIKVSAARCAAVSFRNEDYGLEKCLEVYNRLVGNERVHASALEHQATPISNATNSFKSDDWQLGVTHVDYVGDLWSGNFKGWIQHRQLVANHVKAG